MNKIKKLTTSEVKDLRYKGYEFLVLQGCGGDLKEWVDGITKLFQDEKIIPLSFLFDEVYTFENGNLINLAFALKDKNINMGKLAMLRLKMRESFGAIWLSDYIDNGYIKDIKI